MRRFCMDFICPVCNSLTSYIVKCPHCCKEMVAAAAIQDYFDDYSPYLDKDISELQDGVSHEKCLHIFYCTSCGAYKRVAIDKILI